MLVYVKGVEEELKLPKTVFEKVRKIVDQVSDKYQREIDEARKDKDDEKKWNMAVKKVVDATNKALSEILTPKQMERLAQILRQRYPFQTLEENAKKLRLTEAQQKQIEKVSGEYYQKGLSEMKQKAIIDMAISVLTPDQRKIWESLVGPWYYPPVSN